MPTYEYICDGCSHTLETFQKITDPLLKQCPKCDQLLLKRGIGGGSATLRFMGKGFYITDYKEDEKSKPCHKGSSSCACENKTN